MIQCSGLSYLQLVSGSSLRLHLLSHGTVLKRISYGLAVMTSIRITGIRRFNTTTHQHRVVSATLPSPKLVNISIIL